ncbi:peroxiredoxin-like family protein [Aureibacter tunicatorum]|uniref:thioredoxin-dependent peroxiredoxin n=1 Tax=Aureibacter tunicatorum TaxID=866807 RepID=A0AAE3XM95_9BACT|nr:peroxiredoxin-like family protein [Aureibacter tunicatorum]MDR6239090.1 peroxiredoxin [Aureibacter tunicatorum]BDD04984.1 peroxiredoxin [Aureibacter tunicatorum]
MGVRNFLRTLIVLVGVMAFVDVNSQDISPVGLKVGDKAPEVKGINQFGENINLKDKLKDGKVVVLFYRGSWCPYCKKQLSDLQDSLNLISAKGAEIIAVTPERKEGIKKVQSKLDAGFNILHDKDLEIMKAYDVDFKLPEKIKKKYLGYGINLNSINGDNGENLPIPAVYVIGQNGNIEYRYFDEDYTKRLSVSELLEKL